MAKKSSKAKPEPKPVGRPSKYEPKFCQMLIDHMAGGLSFESFAAVIKVNQDSLHEWVKVYTEFSEAKKVAWAQNQLFYEKMGVAGMAGKIPGFNSTTWIFNMKNRFKWRDKQPEEADVIVNNNNYEKKTDAQLLAEAQELIEKNGLNKK